MEKTDAAVAATINSFDRATGEIIQKLGELTERYGEQSIDLMTRGVALRGINELTFGAGILLMAAFLWKISRGIKRRWEKSDNSIDSDLWAVLRGISLVVVVALTAISLSKLAVASNWYAIFDPKVYVAYEIMKQVIGK